MLYAQIHLTLPAWVHESVDAGARHASDADKVALAIELSRINMEAGTGGPFGAVVFGPDDHIISIGVNRVCPWSAASIGVMRSFGSRPRSSASSCNFCRAKIRSRQGSARDSAAASSHMKTTSALLRSVRA